MSNKANNNILYLNLYNSSACEVYTVWQENQRRKKSGLLSFFSKENFYLLDKWLDKYSKLVKSKHIHPQRLIIYGYKDHEWPVLKTIESKKVIQPQWFDQDLSNSMGVLFVGGGGSLLRTTAWEKMFKHWVSFNDKFDFLVGLPLLDKERKIVFNELFNASIKSKEVNKMKAKFDKIFDDSIKRVSTSKDFDDDGFATVYKLRINKANVTCSQ